MKLHASGLKPISNLFSHSVTEADGTFGVTQSNSLHKGSRGFIEAAPDRSHLEHL